MKTFFTSILLGLLFVSSHSAASDLNYSYVELAYLKSDSDVLGNDVDGDGFGIAVSHDISENLAISFSFQDEDYDFQFDGQAISFGVDYHTPFSKQGDIVLGISIVDAEVSQPTLGSDDDTGNIIEIGIRNRINDTTDLQFFLSRADVFDDTSSSFGFGLNLVAVEAIQLTFGYSSGDDTDVIAFGVRVNY